MSKPTVLVAENLGKKFYRSPNRHVMYGLSDLFRAIARKPPREKVRSDEFWAVRNISFTLKQGQSLGVIGRNGGGKTTLMKLLARTIRPDEGNCVVDGNVQAMINLGAGFSDGLTGRENIINGLAMRGRLPSHLRRRMDEIIDFADIAEFIDSPVNTYSSGMRARLGFALCAHLDPSLVIIDEALSVGDMGFQNKCLLRLQKMRRQGVAMVLVSHSMTHIHQFCDSAMWLEKGELVASGEVRPVVRKYTASIEKTKIPLDPPKGEKKAKAGTDSAGGKEQKKTGGNGVTRAEHGKAGARNMANTTPATIGEGQGLITPQEVNELFGGFMSTGQVKNIAARLLVDGRETNHVELNHSCTVEYEFDLTREVSDLNVSLSIYRRDGLHMTAISTLNGDLLKSRRNGHVHCRVKIRDLNLAPGDYVLAMPIHEGRGYLHRDVVLVFRVLSGARMSWGLLSLDNEYEVLG